MPRFNTSGEERRKRINAAVTRLMEIGWIQATIVHDNLDAMAIKWTDKGKERAKQMNEIVNEFHGSADDLMALAVICRSFPP